MRTGLRNRFILGIVILGSTASLCLGQRGIPPSRTNGFTLFGDVEVTGSEAGDSKAKALLFDLLLYTRSGVLIDRQKVASKGRYRFLNVPTGDYDLVIEFENSEVARTQIHLIGTLTDVRQDITLEWRATSGKSAKTEVVSADEFYQRIPLNQDRFEKSREAFDKKDYERAIALLRQIVADDLKDFQAWSELGTSYLAQNNLSAAETAYLTSIENRPTFFLALLNLGRVRLLKKDLQGAVAILSEAVKSRPTSAEANYFLGEAYLQIKKGSLAVGYLNEALRLDPNGMAEAHLRLALLYNAVGMKDKAAAEYEAFLKKRPDYKERKKLEQYIAENKRS